MTRLTYQDITPIDRAEAVLAFESGQSDAVCDALIRVVYHDPDWQWTQEQCLRFTQSDDPGVRGLAVTCLGHLARIHHRLDLAIVVPVLDDLSKDRAMGGRAKDALDDIKLFLSQDYMQYRNNNHRT
jgi:hypothetical protein